MTLPEEWFNWGVKKSEGTPIQNLRAVGTMNGLRLAVSSEPREEQERVNFLDGVFLL
jgi:hypothetical protein